jgi:hypothetical protein
VEIEARLNSAHVKTSCVVCERWSRPGEVAYFTEHDRWICDGCVKSGVGYIRNELRESAEYHRNMARQYDEVAEEDINILPVSDEVQDALAELQAEYRREMMRVQNTPQPAAVITEAGVVSPDELPF